MGSSKRLRILVVPMNGLGHINACHGLCDELRDRGHEVTFILNTDFKGQLSKYGYKERIIPPPSKLENENGQERLHFWQDFARYNADRFAEKPIEHLSGCTLHACSSMLDQIKHDVSGQVIEELKPDLIIYDGYICYPAIANGKIPWVWLYSAAPLPLLNDDRLPPAFSGLPTNDKSEHEAFRKKAEQALRPLWDQINEYNVSEGGQRLEPGRLNPLSPYLNVYMQPQELRYDDLLQTGKPVSKTIVAAECLVRQVDDGKFEIPAQIAQGPGKLILFALGSFGTANIKLMKRLLSIMAKSPHRFIVSKGPLKYDLPGSNMWGEALLPQTAILPQVDMVICHGGNNTVTESFYFGKKMLILPIFFDQIDNGQRIHETGLGRRVNPFKCSEQELLDAIEMVANDHELTQRMDLIGRRIRDSKDKQRIADLIENLVEYSGME